MHVISHIDILDICLVTKRPDPLGELSWGWLRLKCYMLVYAEFTNSDESGDVLLRSIPELKRGNEENKYAESLTLFLILEVNVSCF
jgi:hypothetical protein